MITDKKRIALNYIKTYFVNDLISAFPFDLFFTDNNIKKNLEIIRVLRIVRLNILF